MYLPQTDGDADLVAVDIDLPVAAAQLRRLQAAVDAHQDGALYGPSLALDAAIRRYSVCWLPLLAAADDGMVPMLPPLDVLWAWTLHMLAPREYSADCQRSFGRILPRAFLSDPDAVAVAEERGRAAWQQTYATEPWEPPMGALGEPYVVPLHYREFVAGESDGPGIHYNLRGSANRQAQAMWNMSRPQFERPAWLAHAAQRYIAFLRLMRMKESPKQMLTPTYDIDLIWHAHMVHPQYYASHSTVIAGKVIGHDDSFNDRGGSLDKAYAYTSELWQRFVGSPYTRCGGMYHLHQ